MGGGFYDGDVGQRTRSTTDEHFNYHGHGPDADASTSRREVHPDLNPKNATRECRDSAEHPATTPIVVAMDVTRSRGDDAKIIFNKLPMFIGQIIMKGYASDPVISFAAIGDATSGDQAPIQVCQFESDNRLDEALSKIWLEEGGGGTGQESYELMAYFYAKHSVLDSLRRGKKGYFFFLGDEGFYPEVARDQAKAFIGDELSANIPSAKIFRELQEKYHVFLVYPKKTWQERKGDIDAEIKKRLQEAGGMYEGVDFRASLIWNTFDDFDLHVIVKPDSECGYMEHIAYNNKSSVNGKGELDVDRNANGRETRKPVENIRWAKGTAVRGKYQVFVRNYRHHDDNSFRTFPIEVKVEVEMNGKIQTFNRTISAETVSHGNDLGPTGSDVVIGEFYFNPNERPVDNEAYAGYDDATIKNQWAGVIPSENILLIDDPKAIVDVMLGALALMEGTDLDNYVVDMGQRGQTLLRQNQARKALENLAGTATALAKIETNGLPDKNSGKARKGKTVRL